MILVDASVWLSHFQCAEPRLVSQLNANAVLAHPFVTGNIALSSLPERTHILRLMRDLPQACVASNNEVMQFIETSRLYGQNLSYEAAHLLAAAKLSGATLWTCNPALHQAGQAHGLAALNYERT